MTNTELKFYESVPACLKGILKAFNELNEELDSLVANLEEVNETLNQISNSIDDAGENIHLKATVDELHKQTELPKIGYETSETLKAESSREIDEEIINRMRILDKMRNVMRRESSK